MTSRLGRRLGKHQVSFAPAASPSISEDQSLSDAFAGAVAQDSTSASPTSGGPSLRTKLSILVVAAGAAAGYVWYKAKDSSPEHAQQYALVAAGGVAGILIYLLFIRRVLG